MSKKICLATLKILLTPKELKNVLGGSNGGYNCYCNCYPNYTFTIWASNCEDVLAKLQNGCSDGNGGGCSGC